jgi:hypothetical protein
MVFSAVEFLHPSIETKKAYHLNAIYLASYRYEIFIEVDAWRHVYYT